MVLVALAGSTACHKAAVGGQGDPIQEDGAPMAVTLESAGLLRAELEGDEGPLIYDEPVLALRLKFENTSDSSVFYQPTHTTDRASPNQAPLLWVDAGEDAPATVNIPGVRLEEGVLDGQQKAGLQVEPGDSVSDIYLFTPPTEDDLPLVLTVPAVLHGGKNPMKIKFVYERTKLPKQKRYKVGKVIKVGAIDLTVTGAKVKYLHLKDSTQGKGYSKDALLVVDYEIKNTSGTDVTYEPNHRASGEKVVGPTLRQDGGPGVYSRVRFGNDREVPRQVAGTRVVAADGVVSDFAVFERPPENVSKVVFVFPGKMVGQAGIYRVAIPIENKAPKKPSDYRKP